MLLPKRKVDLKKLRENLLKYEQEQKAKPIILDDKVDEFINWYSENMVKGHYTDIGEYLEPIEMRNFIEKMAVWYELRYPDYEINRIMPGSGQEMINVSDVMFRNNRYTIDLLDENSDVRELDWDEFYNTKAFINSLPWSERWLLSKPRYQDIVYWNRGYGSARLHLTRNGFVRWSEYMDIIPGISNEDLEDKNIKEVVSMLKEKRIEFQKTMNLKKQLKITIIGFIKKMKCLIV